MGSTSLRDIDQFYSQFPLEKIPKGTLLLSPNEEQDCIFYLESGQICKYDISRFGEKAVMNVFSVPGLIPLSWLLNGALNKYYFETQTPVTIRRVPADAANAHLLANPEIMYGMLQFVYIGLEMTQRRVAQLMRGGLRSRVLFELLVEARRCGEAQADGSTIIRIGEAELADRAGLSRETISRELSKLFKSGNICTRQGRSIVIRDVDELDAMLQVVS